jgi:hypothetical protein
MTRAENRQSSVESLQSVPLVDGENQVNLSPVRGRDGVSECGHDAKQHHCEASVKRLIQPFRSDPNLLRGRSLADWRRIADPRRLRYSSDSLPMDLPGSDLSGRIELILHESSTRLPGRPGSWSSRRLDRMRRWRGVGVVGSRFISLGRNIRGLSGSDRELPRPASKDDAERKRRGELALLLSRTCYWASCYRGIHERPMKMKVARRVGEGFRSRPIISSGETVPSSSTCLYKGVGRTRP